MRILIADDQRSVGTSLAELVGYCNHEVVEVVGSGLEAILGYTRHHPDVVLMDYLMPRLNGATACRNILARDPSARIILVSGWSPSYETDNSGAMALLAKPVRLERLEAMLNAVARTLPPEEAKTKSEGAAPSEHFSGAFSSSVAAERARHGRSEWTSPASRSPEPSQFRPKAATVAGSIAPVTSNPLSC